MKSNKKKIWKWSSWEGIRLINVDNSKHASYIYKMYHILIFLTSIINLLTVWWVFISLWHYVCILWLLKLIFCCCFCMLYTVFKYEKRTESVHEVNETDYEGCNTVGKYHIVFNGGNTKVMLTKPGFRHFISGNQSHCQMGLKLAVLVISSNKTKKNLLSPSPSPSPPPS